MTTLKTTIFTSTIPASSISLQINRMGTATESTYTKYSEGIVREMSTSHRLSENKYMPNAILKAPIYITVQLHLDSNFGGFVLSGTLFRAFPAFEGRVDPWIITLFPDSVSGVFV